jgi:hypothetical protein
MIIKYRDRKRSALTCVHLETTLALSVDPRTDYYSPFSFSSFYAAGPKYTFVRARIERVVHRSREMNWKR